MEFIYRYGDESIHVHHARDKSPCPDGNKMHVHVYVHEIYYFISGKGSYFVEGIEYDLTPGCIMVMKAGETHRRVISPDAVYERISAHIAPEVLEKLEQGEKLSQLFTDKALGKNNQYLPKAFNEELVRSCLMSISKYGRSGGNWQKWQHRMLIQSYIHPVLYEIYRCSGQQENRFIHNTDTVSRVVEYINNHLTDDLNIDMLAGMFFISKSYLSNRFKHITGSTIWEYIIIKRLLLARELIRNGTAATDVAAYCGWKDYSAFFRRYKERFGVSPVEDRLKK